MRRPRVGRLRRLSLLGPKAMGVVGIVLVAAVLAVAVALPRAWYVVRTHAYAASFANAAGLTDADPVYVVGVPAGRVESVELAGDHVVVRFRLDKDQPLGDGTTAAIALRTILGKRALEVTPAGSGRVGPDDTIPLERTRVPYSLDEIATSAVSTGENLDVNAIQAMVQTLGQVLPADADQVSRTLTGVSDAAAVLTRNGEQVTQLLATSRSLSGLVAGQSQSLTTMLGNANAVLGVIAARRVALSRLVQDLRDLANQASAFLTDSSQNLNQLVVNLRSVTDTLSANARNLDTLMTTLPPALRAVTDASGNGSWVDVAAPAGPLPDNLLCQLGLVTGCS